MEENFWNSNNPLTTLYETPEIFSNIFANFTELLLFHDNRL